MIDDGVEQCVGKVVGAVHIEHIESHHVFHPFSIEAGAHGRIVAVSEHIVAIEAVVVHRLCSGDLPAFTACTVGDQRR